MPNITPQRADNDDAGYHGAPFLAQIEDVEMCRAVYAGTRALRSGGEEYLPRFPKEKDSSYERRNRQSVLFNAFRRTVKGLTGMVFRKDPALEEAPDALLAHWENVDLTGRHGVVFARDCFEAKAIDGHTFILVDWRTADGARSRAEEDGARPYWVHILKSQVIRWRTESRGGETVLSRFAYIERDRVPDGEFREKPVYRVRQYDLGGERVTYTAWTRDADQNDGEWVQEDSYTLGDRMTRIPVVADYADRTGFMESTPPLLDLAFENIRHYQLRSDRDNLIHISHAPFPLFTGVPKEKVESVTIGAGFGVVLESPDADGKIVETSGAALEESRMELGDIEERMAALGLAVLVRRDRVQRTATETATEKAEQDSDLAAMARATQDALEEALGLHAMWMGLDDGDTTVTVNKDFMAQTMSAQMVTALSALVGARQMSLETLWDLLVQGELLPDGFDPEKERELIETEPGADLQALRAAMGRGEPDPNANPEDERMAA